MGKSQYQQQTATQWRLKQQSTPVKMGKYLKNITIGTSAKGVADKNIWQQQDYPAAERH